MDPACYAWTIDLVWVLLLSEAYANLVQSPFPIYSWYLPFFYLLPKCSTAGSWTSLVYLSTPFSHVSVLPVLYHQPCLLHQITSSYLLIQPLRGGPLVYLLQNFLYYLSVALQGFRLDSSLARTEHGTFCKCKKPFCHWIIALPLLPLQGKAGQGEVWANHRETLHTGKVSKVMSYKSTWIGSVSYRKEGKLWSWTQRIRIIPLCANLLLFSFTAFILRQTVPALKCKIKLEWLNVTQKVKMPECLLKKKKQACRGWNEAYYSESRGLLDFDPVAVLILIMPISTCYLNWKKLFHHFQWKVFYN